MMRVGRPLVQTVRRAVGSRGSVIMKLKPRVAVAVAGAAGVIAAAALTAALWPSSPGRLPDGPFGRSEQATQDSECIPIPGRIITYGFETVRNVGSADAVIQHIGYVSPHHLKVLSAFVVPPHDGHFYGGIKGYPPSWMRKQHSLTVHPAHGTGLDSYANVILVTELTGVTGHADAVYLDYKENGTLYRFRSITSLTLKRQGQGRCT
jgi:hypothetical protein